MAIIKKITQPGNTLTGSLNGRLVFDQGRGTISVTEEGGQERAKMAIDGFTTTRSDNTRYGKFGQADNDGRDILAIAKPGVDLKNEGI